MEKIHLWFQAIDSKNPDKHIPAKRVDCGAIVGWWPVFLPYLVWKCAQLNNHNLEHYYYIGNLAGDALCSTLPNTES